MQHTAPAVALSFATNQCFKWAGTVRYGVPALFYFESESTGNSQEWYNTFNWRVLALLRKKQVLWYWVPALLFFHFKHCHQTTESSAPAVNRACLRAPWAGAGQSLQPSQPKQFPVYLCLTTNLFFQLPLLLISMAWKNGCSLLFSAEKDLGHLWEKAITSLTFVI